MAEVVTAEATAAKAAAAEAAAAKAVTAGAAAAAADAAPAKSMAYIDLALARFHSVVAQAKQLGCDTTVGQSHIWKPDQAGFYIS